MIAAIAIFVVTYLVIASEKLDKTAAALLGAAVAVSTGVVPYEVALHAVDLNVVLLLVGMMLAVNVLAGTGVFEWAAISVAKRAGGDGRKIVLLLLALTAGLSAFLDNVTTVILVAPITILLCELLVLPVVPFLVLEALASNIGGTATLVGDPPNVLIASKTGLGFNTFLFNLGPPVLIMVVVGLVATHLILGPRYAVSPALRQRVATAQPARAILHPQRLRRALAVFALVMVGFFVSHALGLEPGIIAIAGGLIMAVATGVDLHQALEKVEWNSVLFFIGLFMMIGALEHHEVFTQLGLKMIEWTGGNFVATALLVLWFSALASAVVDNIPLVIAMLPLLQAMVPIFGAQMGLVDDPAALDLQVRQPLYWSLALGACLGGNGTLVGASANVVIAQIGARNKHPISFLAFTKYGLPTMLGSLVIATGWVYLRYLYRW